MKKIVPIMLFYILLGCEEVIDLELPTEDPRLVIDALLLFNENEGEPLTTGEVRLTLTAPFLDSKVPSAEGATVRIIDENTGENFDLTENEPGVFRDGLPNLDFGIEYTLEVIYNGDIYRATQQLFPTGTLTNVEQGDGFLFNSEDETEIIVTFDDIPNQRNYYLFSFGNNNYLVTDDEFYQNSNLTFSYFYENISAGDQLNIMLLGIDQQFAKYADQILMQSGQDNNGPFQVPVGNVRGNIVNTSNADNYPFGYFSISEFDAQSITIE